MKILAIKAQASKVGKQLVIVDTAERTHFVPRGMWTNAGYSEALEAYVGGEFNGDYFQKGEELLNGNPVDQDDVILRSFSAQMNPTILSGIVAAEIAAKATVANDSVLLFRRKRNEALAAKAAAEAAAVKPVDPVTA